MIHVEHLTSVVRVYDVGCSFEAGDEPRAVATLARADAGVIEVMAAMGKLTRADLRDIAMAAAAQGAHTLAVKRRRGHSVPLGRLVRTEGPFAFWTVEVSEL